jgi:hypothetical protein
MIIKYKAISIAVVMVFLTSFLPGCATLEENQQLARTAGAVALGAAAGVATALITGDVAAGVAVGLAGAALGWKAVELMQPESEQVRTAAEDQRLYGFAPATNQVLIRLNKGEATPKTISAGQETVISSDYSLSVPRSYNDQAEVTYLWKLKKDGKVLVESEPVTQTKPAAGHQTSQPIKVPQNADPGTYVVETLLASGSAYDMNETVFVVE